MFIFVLTPAGDTVIFDRVKAGGQCAAMLWRISKRIRRWIGDESRHGEWRSGPARDYSCAIESTYRPIVNEGGAVGQYRLEVETSGATQVHLNVSWRRVCPTKSHGVGR
jgi:hypothetical protein